jgi:hypothetical protein
LYLGAGNIRVIGQDQLFQKTFAGIGNRRETLGDKGGPIATPFEPLRQDGFLQRVVVITGTCASEGSRGSRR